MRVTMQSQFAKQPFAGGNLYRQQLALQEQLLRQQAQQQPRATAKAIALPMPLWMKLANQVKQLFSKH